MESRDQQRAALRALPRVDDATRWPELTELDLGAERRADLVREAIDSFRQAILNGARNTAPERGEVIAAVHTQLQREHQASLRRVLNATGVLIHTNLGRAPLSDEAIAAVAEAARYTPLEMELETGRRGGRAATIKALLRELSGAEEAIVVNNCAAAVLLALSALASGGEVLVSRGELVEIGGSFRVPDIMVQGGARLREVGTTNRTRLADYERAIGEETVGILKVHRSNFQIVGFTEEAPIEGLTALARERGVFMMEDMGAASFLPLEGFALGDTSPRRSVEAGVDVLTFSGDKLLGGPQAGIVLGRKEPLMRCRKHPLFRALRPDKMSLAALEATLRLHRDGERGRERLPLHRRARVDVATLEARARALVEQWQGAELEGVGFAWRETEATLGGGSLPGETLESRAVEVRLSGRDAGEIATALRLGQPSVVGRMQGGSLWLDLRCIDAEDDAELALAVRTAVELCLPRGAA